MEETKKVTHREHKIKKNNAEMTFVEHLDALRAHLIRSILAILFLAIIVFLFKNFVFSQIILKPQSPDFITNKLMCKAASEMHIADLCINQKKLKIVNIELAGQFKAHLMISFVLGIIIAFPYIIFELWRFLKPALKKQELIFTRKMIFWVSFLFYLGIIFGYFIIVPLAINFLSTYSISAQVHNTINFASYYSTVSTTTFGTGIVFEIPILSFVLAKIGILKPALMKKYHRHAIVLAFILAAIVTPPDAFSQILVAFPIILLYEISILIVKKVYKNRKLYL
jgi:sec-independent protein translocase protein TatC